MRDIASCICVLYVQYRSGGCNVPIHMLTFKPYVTSKVIQSGDKPTPRDRFRFIDATVHRPDALI